MHKEDLAFLSSADTLNLRKKLQVVQPKVLITSRCFSELKRYAEKNNVKYICFEHTVYPNTKDYEKDIVRFLLREKISKIVTVEYDVPVSSYLKKRIADVTQAS